MSLSTNGAIKSDPVLGPRVDRANQMLKQIIGPMFDSVRILWTPVQVASGRPLIRLELSDFTRVGQEARFAPEELANEGRLSAKFYRIWGDLLQRRSHQQLNQLSGRVRSA